MVGTGDAVPQPCHSCKEIAASSAAASAMGEVECDELRRQWKWGVSVSVWVLLESGGKRDWNRKNALVQ